eukprot:6345643-Pyramimonas_sp.AAC.2
MQCAHRGRGNQPQSTPILFWNLSLGFEEFPLLFLHFCPELEPEVPGSALVGALKREPVAHSGGLSGGFFVFGKQTSSGALLLLLGSRVRTVKGKRADVKGNSVDVKGNSVDVIKGNRVDVKGSRVDVKSVALSVNMSAILFVSAYRLSMRSKRTF